VAVGHTRNRIKVGAHFWLDEFESHFPGYEGWVMVHPSVINALDSVWTDCALEVGEPVEVIIRCGTRSEAENTALARELGWTDDDPPGKVSRTSKHLPKYGGVAVDFKVRNKRTREWLPQRVVGRIADKYFIYVKYDYADGHVHADNRIVA
jgi:hypothetical protein